MKLVRCGEAASVRVPENYFTGTVWQNPIHRSEDPARTVALSVTFLPGARTNWHHHPFGQILHVISGCGWFQTKGEAKVIIRAGDTVSIPPGEVHWHGATDTTTMTHLAIQERDGEATATWLEPVADADYLAG
jgi:quercetin dioxygenase-like cupin family protein